MSNTVEYDSSVAHISWDEDNSIFIFKMKSTSDSYDAKEVRLQLDFFMKHSNNKPYKVLVDTRESPSLPTDNAFDYFFDNNNSRSKNAIVADDLPFQILMSQIYRIKNIQNCKVFKTEEEAIAWLLED